MTDVRFYKLAEIEDSLLKFAVIASRFENHWVFSRHKERTTWDIPGGHREHGEQIDDTARRELWEETGAVQADIRPICIYGVAKNDETKYGKLYFANITALGLLPEKFEMEEILLADGLPEYLTYPDILPQLYGRVQEWMNLQSSSDELWDVYDENRNLTGRLHRRGDPMDPGDYHLVVEAWMLNCRGEFLLTKRSPNKGFPNMWESTGGSALAGDDSLAAVLREVKEETGLTLDPNRGQVVFTLRRGDSFKDIWLFRQDFDLKDVVLQPGETTDKMYADKDTVLRMWKDGVFVPLGYLDDLFKSAGV